ncbi:uncharacterized protein [Oscarella lobularis]|uniref:uncharacterized protein isoform X2 n=1 Tax=Oscarella lobularis TaxID=121494 RepID=UPI00331336FA
MADVVQKASSHAVKIRLNFVGRRNDLSYSNQFASDIYPKVERLPKSDESVNYEMLEPYKQLTEDSLAKMLDGPSRNVSNPVVEEQNRADRMSVGDGRSSPETARKNSSSLEAKIDMKVNVYLKPEEAILKVYNVVSPACSKQLSTFITILKEECENVVRSKGEKPIQSNGSPPLAVDAEEKQTDSILSGYVYGQDMLSGEAELKGEEAKQTNESDDEKDSGNDSDDNGNDEDRTPNAAEKERTSFHSKPSGNAASQEMSNKCIIKAEIQGEKARQNDKSLPLQTANEEDSGNDSDDEDKRSSAEGKERASFYSKRSGHATFQKIPSRHNDGLPPSFTAAAPGDDNDSAVDDDKRSSDLKINALASSDRESSSDHVVDSQQKKLTMVIDVAVDVAVAPDPDDDGDDKDTMHLFDAKGSASSDSRLPSVQATSQEMPGKKPRQIDESPPLLVARTPDYDDSSDDDSDDDDDKDKKPSKAANDDKRSSDLKINKLASSDHKSSSDHVVKLTTVSDVADEGSDKDDGDDKDTMLARVKNGSASSDPSVHTTSQEMAGEKARQDDQSHSLHAPNNAKASLRTAGGAPDHHDDPDDDDSDDDEDKNKRPSKAAGGKEDSERSRFFRDSFSSQSKTHGIALSSILRGVDQDSLVWPHELIEIPFEQLKAATDDFNSSSVAMNGRFLGSGSFGDVYLGHLRWKDKPFLVAVKKFKPPKRDRPSYLQLHRRQFPSEIRALSACSHKNVVKLLAYSIDSAELCIVYEFLMDGTLKDALSKNNPSPPSWKNRLVMALHVSEALDFIHSSCNLIHRDVKSSNVLLGKNEKGVLIAKLADFGLSSYMYLHEVDGTTESFYATMPVGTKSYMSPEALRGRVSPAVDVYAFGMIMYEIVTGLPPYSSAKKIDLIMYFIDLESAGEDPAILTDPRTPWPPSLARKLFALSKKCTRLYADKRPKTKEIRKKIEDLVNESR